MYNEQIEGLISAALADGVLTEKEKQILFKKAQSQGIDLDEFEMVLDARLVELQKAEKEKAEKSAPKSTKYGDVRKCPVCGALVPALAGVCPECGYEFSEIDANSSAKELASKIASVDAKDKAEVIRTFPIPLTKADLLEFITSLKYKIMDVNDPLSDAYLVKYAECIEKIKVVFPTDSQLSPYVLEFEKIKKTRFWKKFGLWFLKPIQMSIIIAVIIGLFIILVFGFEGPTAYSSFAVWIVKILELQSEDWFTLLLLGIDFLTCTIVVHSIYKKKSQLA